MTQQKKIDDGGKETADEKRKRDSEAMEDFLRAKADMENWDEREEFE